MCARSVAPTCRQPRMYQCMCARPLPPRTYGGSAMHHHSLPRCLPPRAYAGRIRLGPAIFGKPCAPGSCDRLIHKPCRLSLCCANAIPVRSPCAPLGAAAYILPAARPSARQNALPTVRGHIHRLHKPMIKEAPLTVARGCISGSYDNLPFSAAPQRGDTYEDDSAGGALRSPWRCDTYPARCQTFSGRDRYDCGAPFLPCGALHFMTARNNPAQCRQVCAYGYCAARV